MAATRIRPAPLPALETRRGVIERLIAFNPGFGLAMTRLTMRLPQGRLRRALVSRLALGFVNAFNRRDFALIPTVFAATSEFRPASPGGVTIGVDFKPCYRGPAGLLEFAEQWADTLGDSFRVECKEVIDLGDRILALNELHGRLRGGTTDLRQPEAQLVTFAKTGYMERLDQFWSWTEALDAVGLPQEIATRASQNGRHG